MDNTVILGIVILLVLVGLASVLVVSELNKRKLLTRKSRITKPLG